MHIWAFFCQEAGEERYVLDAIIGEGMKSTEGGIGVENLQGSGLIAGETSRAYQDARGSRVAESFHLLDFDFVGSCKLSQFTIPYAPRPSFLTFSHTTCVITSALFLALTSNLFTFFHTYRRCKRTPSPSLTSLDARWASVRT